MNLRIVYLGLVACIGLCGCGGAGSVGENGADGANAQGTPPTASADNAATASEPSAAHAAGLGLSDADKTLAHAQGICPVTDEKLFEHGDPIKVRVNDTAVFVCCDECSPKLKQDAEKFLAKLKATAKPADAKPEAPREKSNG